MWHRHIHRTYVPDGIYPHTKTFGVGVYFVTTYVRHRIAFFSDAAIATIAERSIRWKKRSAQCIIYAYVVMSDHLHLLVQPTMRNISELMRSIKTNSSREINRYLSVPHRASHTPHNASRATRVMGTGGTLVVEYGWFAWQEKFYDHVIRDERDFRNHVEYIRYNPVNPVRAFFSNGVKAGLVEKPEDYPFLSVDYDAIRRLFGG